MSCSDLSGKNKSNFSKIKADNNPKASKISKSNDDEHEDHQLISQPLLPSSSTTGQLPLTVNKNNMKIKYLCTKYNARTTKRLLVTNEALYIDFLFDNKLVDEVSKAFEQLKVVDTHHVNIPFMACAPGSGKTRTLQEIFSKTKQGQMFKENSLELLISFGNTTPIGQFETNIEKALCDRVLYSYFNCSGFEHFSRELEWLEYSFENVLELIAEHWRETHSKDLLAIYLGIDEYTFDTSTFLEGAINIIGHAILEGPVRLFPFFAGLDYQFFSDAIAKSTFSCSLINPYRFTLLDEQEIVKRHFSEHYHSKELWRAMTYFNSGPRLIAWFIVYFKIQQDIKRAYEETVTHYKLAYRSSNIPDMAAKWILAHVITQEPITNLETIAESIDWRTGNRIEWTIKN